MTDPRLQYQTAGDAVEKWDAVLRDPELKARLLADQLARRPHLTKERFLSEFETIINRCFEVGVERV